MVYSLCKCSDQFIGFSVNVWMKMQFNCGCNFLEAKACQLFLVGKQFGKLQKRSSEVLSIQICRKSKGLKWSNQVVKLNFKEKIWSCVKNKIFVVGFDAQSVLLVFSKPKACTKLKSGNFHCVAPFHGMGRCLSFSLLYRQIFNIFLTNQSACCVISYVIKCFIIV